MSEFKNWIGDILIINTQGNGWCVRIDGCDVFDNINQHGVKGRRSLEIVSHMKSKEAAQAAAVQWLERQLAKARGEL